MNGYCDGCRRSDICLCDLPADPTVAAVEILDAARSLVVAATHEASHLARVRLHGTLQGAPARFAERTLTDAIYHLQGVV